MGILSGPLTVSLFQYGKFTAFDALMTQRALIAYSVGLIGLIVVKVLARLLFPPEDIKTPVKIAIVTLILTQLMNGVYWSVETCRAVTFYWSGGVSECFAALLAVA